MTNIVSTALSGLNVASARVQASANNVANANSNGALPLSDGSPGPGQQAYQPIQVSQTTLSGFNGVTASTAPVEPRSVTRYDPNASYANGQGLIASPNVDNVTEVVNQIAGVASYKANAAVLKVADELNKTLLNAMKPSSSES